MKMIKKSLMFLAVMSHTCLLIGCQSIDLDNSTLLYNWKSGSLDDNHYIDTSIHDFLVDEQGSQYNERIFWDGDYILFTFSKNMFSDLPLRTTQYLFVKTRSIVPDTVYLIYKFSNYSAPEFLGQVPQEPLDRYIDSAIQRDDSKNYMSGSLNNIDIWMRHGIAQGEYHTLEELDKSGNAESGSKGNVIEQLYDYIVDVIFHRENLRLFIDSRP